MLRKWHKFLAVLLAIALVATTFNSSHTSIKVFAEDEDPVETVETVSAEPAQDYQEPESEPEPEPEYIPEEDSEEEFIQNAGDDGASDDGGSQNGGSVEEPGAEGEDIEPGEGSEGEGIEGEEPSEELEDEEEPEEEEELEEEEEELEEEIPETKPNFITVTYSAELGGRVSKSSETIDINDKEARFEGSTASAVNKYYQFTAWVDEDGNPVSSDSTFTPSGLEKDAAFTAKFMQLSYMPAKDFSGSDGGIDVSVSADAGIFPEGTEMVVSAISEAQAYDAAVAAIGEAVTEAKGVDISFIYEGSEIEPANANYVHVSISLNNTLDGESFAVVHQDDSGNSEVVAGASAGGADFDANQFSVYIVAASGDSSADEQLLKRTATYTFYVGDEIFNVQIVKKDEVLNYPGIPHLEKNQKFLGWKDKTDKSLIFPDGVETITMGDIAADTVVEAYADIKTTYYLTFRGINDETVQVKSVTVGTDEGDSASADIDTTDVLVQPESVDQAFLGWTVDKGSDTVYATVDASQKSEVYPVIKDAYWVTFDENDGGTGGGASYTAPMSVEKGKAPVMPKNPTRRGYEFRGWWTGKGENAGEVSGVEFTESYELEGNITVYAKWIPSESTTYTVIIWQQNVKDSINATKKTYDFVEANTLTGTTGHEIGEDELSTYTSKQYEGFHYGGYKIVKGASEETTSEIRAKGDTVVNVYYDRNEMTIKFFTRQNNQWKEYKTFTGLYDQTLSDCGYTWPSEYYWYDKTNINYGSGATRLTFLASFKFTGLSGLSDDKLTLTQYGHDKNGSSHVHFIQQDVNGVTYPTTDTNTMTTSNGTFTITDKYTGFKAAQVKEGNNGSWQTLTKGPNGNYGTFDVGNNLYIRYERLKYDIAFFDNFNGNLDDLNKPIKNIPYQADISPYEGQEPEMENKPGYAFKGWYLDPKGQNKFTWSGKMPASDIVLYAYYEVVKYHIVLDADGGTLPQGQSGDFYVDYGTILEKVSLNNTNKDGYDLVGWFDTDAKAAYGFGKVESDVNLKAIWRNPGTVDVIYDAGEHGDNAPKDPYHYAGNSGVVVGAPPKTVESGWTFIGYTIAGGSTIYYPNGHFTITPDLVNSDGNVVITAQYLETGGIDKLYTKITYNANGGVGAPVEVLVGKYGNLLVNEAVIALDNEGEGGTGFTKAGCEFKGWSRYSGDDNEVEINPGERIAGDLNTPFPNVLYAVWEVKSGRYVVEYYKGEPSVPGDLDHFLGKTELSEPQDVGTPITLSESELNAKKSEAGAGYGDGRQEIVPYIIEQGDENIIRVVYDPIEIKVVINGIVEEHEYDGTEYVIDSFTVTAPEGINYTINDIEFNSEDITVSGKHAAEYTKQLTANMFRNKNPGFDDNFVKFEIGENGSNKLTITPKEIKVTTPSASKPYDGDPLTAEGQVEGILEGEKYEFVTTGTITDPGETPNTYELNWLEGEDAALASDYDLPEENISIGTLVVTQSDKDLVVIVTGGEFPYDGQPHGPVKIEIQGLENLDGYTYEATSDSTVTDVADGTVSAEADNIVIYFKGEDVTAEMEKNIVSRIPGDIKIIPAKVNIEVEGNYVERKYTGEEFTAEGYEITKIDNELYKKENITFKGEAVAKRKDPGTTYMELDQGEKFGNKDSNFEANFVITDGYVKITDRNPGEELIIVAITDSFSREYTGETFTDFDYRLEGRDPSDGVMDRTVNEVADFFRAMTGTTVGAADIEAEKTVEINGVTFRVEGLSVDQTARNVGKYDLPITGTMQVYQGDTNVTQQFRLETREGVFEITPREITVTSASGSKVYNGSPLTNHNVKTDVPWGEGDYVEYDVTGSQTAVGSSKNEFTIIWGNTLESNYKPNVVFGTLTVTNAGPGPGPTPTPDPGPTTTTIIVEVPTPTAPAPAVLGERREQEGAAVLGARRGRTEDDSNQMARFIAILVSAAVAITLFASRKKEEEEK